MELKKPTLTWGTSKRPKSRMGFTRERRKSNAYLRLMR